MKEDTDCLREIQEVFKIPFLLSTREMVERLQSIYSEYLEILKSQPPGYGILRNPDKHLSASIPNLENSFFSNNHEIYDRFKWYLERIPAEIRIRRCAKWISNTFVELDHNQLVNLQSNFNFQFPLNRVLFQRENWMGIAHCFLEQFNTPLPFSHSSVLTKMLDLHPDEDIFFLNYEDQDGDCSEIDSYASLKEFKRNKWFRIDSIPEVDKFFSPQKSGNIDNVHLLILPESRHWVICHHINFYERIYRMSFHGEPSVLEHALGNINGTSMIED